MLPGLSSVLRRDKERQRASALSAQPNGGEADEGWQQPPTATTGAHAMRRDETSTSSSSSLPQSPLNNNNMRRQVVGTTGMAPSPSSSGSRTPGLLPEEHRAREKERERLARAQLSNAHTQQMMANRQMRQDINATAQSDSDGAHTRYSSSHMESSVTRLLVATKMLLEALTKWSLGQRTESQVSDIYVRLGNDFNVANVAFGTYGIDMSDLASVPDDLRDCLERCLSEDASPQTLEVHLPRIREIIIGLLQGLKSKQAEYKQLVIQRRASNRTSKMRLERAPASDATTTTLSSTSTTPAEAGAQGSDSVQRSASGKSTTPSLPMPSFGEDVRKNVAGKRPLNAPPLEGGASIGRQGSDGTTRQGGPTRTGSNNRRPVRRDTSDSRSDGVETGTSVRSPLAQEAKLTESDTAEAALGLVNNGNQSPERRTVPRSFTTGALRGDETTFDDPSAAVQEIGDAADPSVRALKSREALERRASKRFSAYTFNKMGVGLNQGLGMSSYGLSGPGSASSSPVMERMTGHTPSRGSFKRSGLTRSSSDMQGIDTPTKGPLRTSLATETIAEDVDPPLRKRGSRTSPRQSPRNGPLALAPPLPMMKEHVNSSTESLPFVDAQSPTRPEAEIEPMPLQATMDAVPPVPPVPLIDQPTDLDAARDAQAVASRAPIGNKTPTAASYAAASLSLFLQLGRQTKKVVIDLDPTLPLRGLSTGKLRMLFMDKFSYSPGKEDFPTIYVKDPHSGVTYELEDLTELGDGTVLTLNIEPLDQMKQHLDLTLGTITRELRDLKSALHDRDREWSRRLSVHPPTEGGLSPQMSMAPRISDAQFAMAGVRVAQYKRATMFLGREQGEAAHASTDGHDVSAEKAPVDDEADVDASPLRKSGGWQIAGDQLKKQYEEVLNVRRQLAVMMQIQDDFKGEVGGLLGTLREQAKRVRAIAATEVPTERNFIITGKARLDSNSQEILTLVEDLLDMVDDLRADVIQRGVKPKPNAMKKMGEDIDRATRGLEELSKYVDTVKPSWKKTWEMELQNIVDEQEFLNHQEGLIADLKEDHANLQDVFHNIQEVVKLRGANKYNLMGNGSQSDAGLSNVALRTYIPPPPEEGHEGLSTVMMEVRTRRPDHEKRLKALEAAEKQRRKEIHHRRTEEDGFQNELSTFVDGKVLRKTGGYLETERVRGRRDKMTLNAMFGGGGSGGAPVGDAKEPPPRRLVLGGGGGGGGSSNEGRDAPGGSSSSGHGAEGAGYAHSADTSGG